MRIHLVIMQPQDYVHSLGLLDAARYLRYQLRRLGAEVTLTKNVGNAAAVNIVLGAHLGLPDGWGRQIRGLIFNQEQVGDGGAALPPAYMDLLAQSHVVDYDPANLAAYQSLSTALPGLLRSVVPLLDAPYLRSEKGLPELADRPIDLLFFGSMNERRHRLIERIERCGRTVHRFDGPVYGPERDAVVAQSKAVLNIPFYDSNRFERVRTFQALSLGTPVVSLRRRGLVVDSIFDDAVQWFTDEQTEFYFTHLFATVPWMQDSQNRLQHWQAQDPLPAYAQWLAQLEATDFYAKDCHGPQTLKRRAPWINLTPSIDQPLGWTPHSTPRNGDAAEVACATIRPSSTQSLVDVLMQAGETLQPESVLVVDWELGVYGHESGLAGARTLCEAQIRHALEIYLQRAPGEAVFELSELKWISRAAHPMTDGVGGNEARDARAAQPRLELARLILLKREATVRELTVRRTGRDDFGGLPADHLPAEARAAVDLNPMPRSAQDTVVHGADVLSPIAQHAHLAELTE